MQRIAINCVRIGNKLKKVAGWEDESKIVQRLMMVREVLFFALIIVASVIRRRGSCISGSIRHVRLITLVCMLDITVSKELFLSAQRQGRLGYFITE